MPLLLAVIAINGVTGASVAAQTADEQAAVPLSPNERVRVQDATGRRLVGTFTAADPERLILTIDGTPVTLQRSTVARLERQQRDSVWNGVFIAPGSAAARSSAGFSTATPIPGVRSIRIE